MPYVDFIRALESLLGRLDPSVLSGLGGEPPDRVRAKLATMVGVSGFALFQKIEHGAILRSLTGRGGQGITYVFGNPLIAVQMTRHEPVAALYVPPRLFVCDAGGEGVIVTYDVPSATLTQFHSPAVEQVAEMLDAKVAKLVDVAAALATKRARRTDSFRSAEGSRR